MNLESDINEKEKLFSHEERIKSEIEQMRSALSQEKNPDFKKFWDAKKNCLLLFKEHLNPVARAHLWSEYIELSDEAKNLKNILSEEASFAMEQIDLALRALETDIAECEKKQETVADIQIPAVCKTLCFKRDFYNKIQKELILLNNFAHRINALRKEVIQLDLRFRYKNRLFKSLSLIGDKVFPRRKELILAISEQFAKDVDWFASKVLQKGEVKKPPLFILRQEIKAMQELAKVFTLSSSIFTSTRLKLSECWDAIKEEEKVKKQETLEEREAWKKNAELAKQRIVEFLEKKNSEGFADLVKYVEELPLFKEDAKLLKEELSKVEKDLFPKEEKEIEKNAFEEVRALIEQVSPGDENLGAIILNIENRLQGSNFNSFEEQVLKYKLDPLKDSFLERAVSDEEEDLSKILELKMKRRDEIKVDLEKCRKALGVSGFDFEKAMAYREIIDAGKEKLQQINTSIMELEEKLEKLE